MIRETLFVVMITTVLGAIAVACSPGPMTQAEANVAEARATGAEVISAADGDFSKTEARSDKSNAAELDVANATAASAHDVAIANCAGKPVADRPDCGSKAEEALSAANQKSVAAESDADHAKPAAANSGTQ